MPRPSCSRSCAAPEYSRSEGARTAQPASAASAFVQLGWPWLATRRAADLPETLEPPDGLLAGLIAASALARGTFRSVAGTRAAGGACRHADTGLGPRP